MLSSEENKIRNIFSLNVKKEKEIQEKENVDFNVEEEDFLPKKKVQHDFKEEEVYRQWFLFVFGI